jgi:formate-dependent nitrite reductase membrane component NrfD
MAEHMVQVSWNQQHQIPWHWPIPAYLVTKHVAGGTFALLGLAALAGRLDGRAMVGPGAVALAALAITFALLVYDLDRPDRVIFLFTRPQWRSWVARAAWLLGGFALVAAAWYGLEVVGLTAARPVLAALAIPLGGLSAIYTAFLLAQAEGRDLWQSPHLPFLMTAQAVALGAGTIAAFPSALAGPAGALFAAALLASAILTVVGDLGTPQATEVARRGVHRLVFGPWRSWYWIGGIGVGHLLPLALLAAHLPASLALVTASIGLFAWARAFVTAPQEIPNS